jgi:hypothetical protein
MEHLPLDLVVAVGDRPVHLVHAAARTLDPVAQTRDPYLRASVRVDEALAAMFATHGAALETMRDCHYLSIRSGRSV